MSFLFSSLLSSVLLYLFVCSAHNKSAGSNVIATKKRRDKTRAAVQYLFNCVLYFLLFMTCVRDEYQHIKRGVTAHTRPIPMGNKVKRMRGLKTREEVKKKKKLPV